MKISTEIETKIGLLLKDCKDHNFKENDIEIIRQAAIFAAKKHDGQLRKSGEPYIIHPIATARILVSWNMDLKTIVTGLLHDVLEDTQTSNDEIVELFGADICQLVNYVTKVNLFSKENRGINKQTNENEYLIQVLLSMSHDIRAMIVKLADRFHNMSTINYLPRYKQIQIADETLNIYAKVAGRLGMYRLKTNLLDMSFEVLNKEAYDATKQIINNIENTYHNIWEEVTNKIIGILDSYSIKFILKKRLKGIYSTYEKLEKGYRINDIHDIYAIRIITNNNLDCYTILGLIHMNFLFISNAFKDYISMPKFNYYQSLHTTIVRDQALIEIQIRTQAMDLLAENGIAAHWNYKETNDYKKDLPTKFLVEEINNLQEKTESNIRGITNDNIFSVIIINNEKPYTVNNKTHCIDLAYRFDNNLFKFLKKIIVNGKPTSFDSLLKPQDVIKFIYSNEIQITRKWLKFTNFHVTIDGIK
ncbi:MAG: HD domain-containing protein, partial [Ureaplasma sp.]|nr:HD domain-containing protein [Ureaplasma sp.]